MIDIEDIDQLVLDLMEWEEGEKAEKAIILLSNISSILPHYYEMKERADNKITKETEDLYHLTHKYMALREDYAMFSGDPEEILESYAVEEANKRILILGGKTYSTDISLCVH